MAEYTSNYKLEKQQPNEYIKIEGLNGNFDKIDSALGNTAKFGKAGGTSTVIALSGAILEDGICKTFIVSTNNNGSSTTINGKPLYKPGTTTAPNLVAGKAVTVWYDTSDDCFYCGDIIPEDARFTDTVYTHPDTHPYSMITGAPTSLPANGGNASTVGGKSASDFLAKTGGTLTGKLIVNSASAEDVSGSGSPNLEVQGTGGGASFMSFHRPGAFAANFGLNKNNQFAVGGWSMGAFSYPIYHQGNIIKSTSAPSNLADGSIWLMYE